ncbi:MAG TPA: CHAT domain-containing protein [Coleofasciculaceae cyanobacterium]
MKTVVSPISLLFAVLHLTGTLSLQPGQAQTAILTSDQVISNSPAQTQPIPQESVIPPHLNALDQERVTQAVPLIEQTWEKQYEDFFQRNFSDQSITVQKIANILDKTTIQTQKKSALLYVVPRPKQLELVLITPTGQPIHKRVSDANLADLKQQAQELRLQITNPIRRTTHSYLPPAQQLYQWVVAPLEADLQSQGIDTLIFCMGEGLRTLPFAALHDGQQFLVEKYSLALIPAFKLTNVVYADLKNSSVLAMGASEFPDQSPLPAVPTELSSIRKNLWSGKSFLNREFTLTNLQSQRRQQPFRIIHLATHATFQPGVPNNSYIQFWDTKLTLDKIGQLRWNDPPVELLVLSACKTAFGDRDVELGFAGLAVQANVKSAIASLWNVSDLGTLGLMTEFYRTLKHAPTKAEALRQAQLAMIKGQVRLEAGQLHSSRETIPLPRNTPEVGNQDLSHPYYWASFTVVGSPW